MIELSRRSGICISRDYENQEFYNLIKRDLTRRSKNYNSSDFITTEFYLETNKFLIIPRYFPIHKYIQCNIKDNSHIGKDINIEHHIKLRNSLQERAVEYMLSNDRGIIELNPGVGKTVISIYMVCERKKKTIVLVHKDYLATQWRKRFLQHTNISEDEIIRLTSSNFKKALTKSIIIVTDQTFISLMKKKPIEFLIELDKAKVGIFISDECHTTTGAPLFSQSSLHIPARVTYGLSATPYRFDGNSDVIEFHLGKIFSDEDTAGTMDGKVTVILTDFLIDIPYRERYIRWEGQFQRSRYLNLIKNSKNFLSLAKGLLNKFKDNKKILFICERINLIDMLLKWVDHSSKAKFVGGSKDEVLEEDIIFSTPGKIRDGVDVPEIDCLIMTSPISNIKQMTGRATRESKDKEIPIIIDIVDYGCKDISNSFYGRLKYYEGKNWDIQFLLSSKDKIIQIDKEHAIDILKGN